MNQQKTILFSGGGTVGPVTPLLAVYQGLKQKYPDFSYHWVGTKNGPERTLVADQHLPFSSLPVVKLDRFISLRNLLIPFRMVWACIKAWQVLGRIRPDLVVTAGGFVSVPLFWMAKVHGISTHVHQLDIRPGLANKLIAPIADKITVTFESSLKDFSKKKTVHTGISVREVLFNPPTDSLPLSNEKPVILIFGGGTGALAINELVWGALDLLTEEAQVIHLTGKGKGKSVQKSGYYPYEFLVEEMPEAFSKADIVVTRGGLGTFLELAALQKPAIVIPMPNTHQEDNTKLLVETKSARVLDQRALSPQMFASEVIGLLKDKDRQELYSQNISQFYDKNSLQRIIAEIENLLYSEGSNYEG